MNMLERKVISTYLNEGFYLPRGNPSTVLVSFVNPYSYSKLIEKSDLELIKKIDRLYVDGAVLAILLRMKYRENIRRLSFDFSSVASTVFSHCVQHRLAIAIIGSTQANIDAFTKYVKEIYPNINIVLSVHGYLDDAQSKYIIDKVNDADVIIIGMGVILQETLGVKIKEKYSNGKTIYTCGGFIEQTALRGDYYHPIIKKTGLLWLQRAIEFPHVRKRLLIDYPKFLFCFLSSWWRGE